jgi:3D (Asp-Asp-Asp) domain-containing protein
MSASPSRLAAAAVAGFALLVCSAPSAQPSSLAQQKRSAELRLYALDMRVASTGQQLANLEAHAAALRRERVVLVRELRLARVDARVSEQRLAERLRALYDHSGTSTVDLLFGATSLSEIFTQLDNLSHVSSLDRQILVQLRHARTREIRAKRGLAAREARLAAAISGARAEAASLASARAAQAAFVQRLAAEAAAAEAQAQAAEQKTRVLTVDIPRPAPGSITFVTTGYCLHGRTATGIPVGWGVAAVDPSVIPLGTRLMIPGYGQAVAADTGGAIVGGRIDLWFPSCAQAGGWGSRSVTIALH